MKTSRLTLVLAHLVLTMLCISIACATFSPRQTGITAGKIYVEQYDLYLNQILKPDLDPELKKSLMENPQLIKPEYQRDDLTQEQYEVLNKKWKILQEVDELLKMIDSVQAAGGDITPEIQAKLIEKLNELLN